MPVVNANNRVKVTGVIISEFRQSHRLGGRNFYFSSVCVSRRSGNKDILPVLVPGELLEVNRHYKGSLVRIEGQFRSFRRTEKCKNRLILYIYVTDMSFSDESSRSEIENQIYLKGYIYRVPVLRKTPFGRDIADIFITVGRSSEISDYIPCIAWNHNAKAASKLAVPSVISLNGRIQSRDYMKRRGDGEMVRNTAYEVSVKEFAAGASDVDISPLSC